jgi:hypothetical protein
VEIFTTSENSGLEIISNFFRYGGLFKYTFVIRIYSVTGRRYVMKKVDKLTKNRREMDRENISRHMPEDRDLHFLYARPYKNGSVSASLATSNISKFVSMFFSSK